VSCRRLREAAAFFRDVAGVPPLSDVDRAARKMARSVRKLREIDVGKKTLSQHPLPEADGRTAAARDKLLRAFDERRRRIVSRRAKRIARRAEALAQAILVHLPLRGVVAPSEPEPDAEARLRMFVENRLAERRIEVEELCREALGRVLAAGRSTTSVPDPEALHAVRVAIKHWRYATEIARALTPRILYRPMAAKLRALQDAGGHSQDCVDLLEMAERAFRRTEHAPAGSAALLAALRSARGRSVREFAATLRALVLAEPARPRVRMAPPP
jgi:CHAD domain-containing protein